jgi:hypothetical protein
MPRGKRPLYCTHKKARQTPKGLPGWFLILPFGVDAPIVLDNYAGAFNGSTVRHVNKRITHILMRVFTVFETGEPFRFPAFYVLVHIKFFHGHFSK